MAARYYVQRGADSMGNRYATGPLVFLETDDFGAAQAEVIARGGEVIDRSEKRGWTVGVGWYDLAEYFKCYPMNEGETV